MTHGNQVSNGSIHALPVSRTVNFTLGLGFSDDYIRMFAGNTDDCFRLGVKLSKSGMKLYSDFYQADILICSPLGLRLIIGADG